MDIHVRHIGIVTSDLESSLRFYRDFLEFKEVRRMEESNPFIETVLGIKGVSVTTIKMSPPGDGQIELLYFESHKKKQSLREINDIGVSHFALTVENVDQLYERLINFGVPFISPPKLSDDGAAKVAFCKAPEGTFLELVEIV